MNPLYCSWSTTPRKIDGIAWSFAVNRRISLYTGRRHQLVRCRPCFTRSPVDSFVSFTRWRERLLRRKFNATGTLKHKKASLKK